MAHEDVHHAQALVVAESSDSVTNMTGCTDLTESGDSASTTLEIAAAAYDDLAMTVLGVFSALPNVRATQSPATQ